MGLIYSCGSDDEVNPTFTVNYKNQELQGKIGGEDFLYIDGLVTSAPTGNQFLHTFTILDTLIDTLTCLPVSDSTKIKWTITADSALVQPGERKLFFDPLEPSKTVSIRFIYYDTDSTQETVTVTKGAYEIVSVDTTLNIISGRMHVKKDNKNTVNGNFKLRYCLY